MKPLNLSTINISGINLVEASAGTGKTWTIAALYILLLLEKELQPEQILVVTYTKAATSELRERIRKRIATVLDLYSTGRPPLDDELEQLLMTTRRQDGERAVKLLRRALYSFDNAAIFTIHGFCQRALLENIFESGSLFGSDMVNDQSAIVKQVCDDFWRAQILNQPDDFVGYLVSQGYTPEKLASPFNGHLQNPYMKIIPQVGDTPFAPLIAERDTLYANISSIWKNERKDIVAELEQARLNQQSYKPSQIDAASSALDSWIASGNAASPMDKLDFFSARKIASKVTKTSPFTPQHPFFTLCQQLSDILDSIRNTFDNRIISCRHGLKQWLEQELTRRKRELNQRSFDDLLLDLNQAFESKSGNILADKLRQRYGAAMIDEFQDTDPIQWNIFKRIGAQKEYPLFLIGDPKQAIYSFRGADVFAYLSAGKGIKTENRHTLGINFRSAPELVNAVNTIFGASSEPFKFKEIPFLPVSSGRSANDRLLFNDAPDQQPFRFWVYPKNAGSKAEQKPIATSRIVSAVAGEIARLLQPGRVTITSPNAPRSLKPADIAVLVKSHKQADRVQKALSFLGIPSVQQGSTTIYETAEAIDLLRIIRAVAEPHNEALIREALLTRTMGLTANDVSRYLKSSGEDPEWEEWLLRFKDMQSVAISGGIVAVASRLLGICGVKARLLSRLGGERILTNILHCSELLHQVEQENGKSLSGLIAWLERKIASPGNDDAALLRLETDENAVMIATIHASKGLQYPVVFVPFAWDAPSGKPERALFHNDDGDLTLDLAESDDNLDRTAAERLAEAARLLYVALTRAEFRCYCIWGAINGAVDSPLFQMLHSKYELNGGKGFYALSDQQIQDKIQLLSEEGKTGIFAGIMPVDTVAPPYKTSVSDALTYASRTLDRPVIDDWNVASFSSITSRTGHIFEPHDHDRVTIESEAPQPEEELMSGKLTIFDFPRGAKAGICLHEIFEQLDFQQTNPEYITTSVLTSLTANNFDEQWLPAVMEMLKHVTCIPIVPDVPDFSLSQLKKGDWLTEMEFYLPVRQLAPKLLQSLFEETLDMDSLGDYHELLKHLSFRQSRGMMQGFIDLLFTYKDRYYILDWKSNHLGMKRSDYDLEKMNKSMCQSGYILQYHLYTLALDRLLKLRLPEYSYERDFGGVIYLYLRGISKDDAANGVYFARPKSEFIRRAGELMLGN